MVLVDAMVKAGSTDPAKYLPVLAKTDGYKGRDRDDRVRRQGRHQERALTLYTYKGGQQKSRSRWCAERRVLACRVPQIVCG